MSDTHAPPGLANGTFTWVDTPDDSVKPTPELFPEFYVFSLDAFMTSSRIVTKADFAPVALWLSSHEVQLNAIWLQSSVGVGQLFLP
jgi:hypothetical protein